ncbi:MAG TPA: tetratricopeptide repeat-containing protein [Hyphomonas sp.]|nr:tetratricopeptide repeat-containing protein [Hyphomonas sp.]
MTISDRQGVELVGASARAAQLFDLGCNRFGHFCGDPIEPFREALADSPDFPMALIAKAWIYALSTEPQATAQARRMVEDLKEMPKGLREASHFEALRLAAATEWTMASRVLDLHNANYPTDLIGLLAGHQVDFLTANARNLRDRIARALPAWEGVPGRSLLLGMLAFGLEEAGDYTRAEAAGMKALEADADDCWAHHAVAHVMEMQGRAAEGRDFIRKRKAHWAQPDNFLKVHNWWHLALCHLELGEADAALALYDDEVRGEPSTVAQNLVDASALLWRLHLLGVDVGDRWEELAEVWTQHADAKCYPFNDVHAAFAYIGAGRRSDATDLVKIAYEGQMYQEMNRWMRDTGAPVIDGLLLFDRGEFAASVELLLRARQICNSFGGSHAQRDVIDWTLTEAALRAKQMPLARALAQERLALRPASRVNIAFARRAGLRLN